MGNARTFTVWLVVLSLQLAPRVTYADVGPGREVRAIRHDLPIILRARTDTSSFGTAPVIIRSVSVDGAQAIAEWDAVGGSCRGELLKRFDRWWLVRLSLVLGNPVLGGGGPLDVRPACVLATEQSAWELLLDRENYVNVSTYQMHVRFAENDGSPNARLVTVTGRAPTEGESWITPNNNGFFFFSGTLSSPTTIHVDGGTPLDVRFPFVLDPSKTYSLTIAHVIPVIGPLNGALKNNTLHFVLPAFAMSPGVELMGEIDGD